MQKYVNNGKTYEVDEIIFSGEMVNVNGTTITDCGLMRKLTGDPFMPKDCYTVFCDSDEIVFHTFEEAYNFAMNEQKDTFRLER